MAVSRLGRVKMKFFCPNKSATANDFEFCRRSAGRRNVHISQKMIDAMSEAAPRSSEPTDLSAAPHDVGRFGNELSKAVGQCAPPKMDIETVRRRYFYSLLSRVTTSTTCLLE